MVRLGLVVAEFADVAPEMAASARDAASEQNADIVEERWVPGVYDTPLAADRLARREDIDAVAVTGAVVSGDTDHDQVISDAAATRLIDVSLERDKPVTFGVTGPGMSGDEAAARSDYGARAVNAAIELLEEL